MKTKLVVLLLLSTTGISAFAQYALTPAQCHAYAQGITRAKAEIADLHAKNFASQEQATAILNNISASETSLKLACPSL